MKKTRQSNPKKKKAKASTSSPTRVGPVTLDEHRDRTCDALAEQMNAAGVRDPRTGPEVRHMIHQIESAFARAHIFSISHVGIDMAMEETAIFREAMTKLCPHYFQLFPVMIHHVDDLAEEMDPRNIEMLQFILEPDESSVENAEEEGRLEWNEDLERLQQQKRVDFQKKCQEHYQRWKAQGHTDAELFERFPEWVVAVVPERN